MGCHNDGPNEKEMDKKAVKPAGLWELVVVAQKGASVGLVGFANEGSQQDPSTCTSGEQ